MNALLFIFSWYNLPFTSLIGVCVLLTLLQLIGLGGQHEGDADVHADMDHDLDLDHGVEIDHSVDVSHDIDHDLDHDIDQDLDQDVDHDVDHDLGHEAGQAAGHDVGSAGGFSFLSVLTFLGLGKAPLLVVLMIFFGSMGILGWLINACIVSLFGGGYPSLAFAGVMLVVLVLGGVVSSRATLFIARTLPPLVTNASRAEALVGRPGTVISPTVDESYGQVHLRDPGGTLITIFAVTQAEAPILRGEEVVVVSYEAAQKRYLVTRSKQIGSTQPGSR